MIHQLTSDTISKIAAGEIIEEPASIVKELLENSIDAGSDQIQIQVNQSCQAFIQVTDNGQGIPEEDLELAFKRHATSKISSIEDLANTWSLGFRGEALASINHVSQVEIISRPEGQDYACRLVYNYGKKIIKEKIGAPLGTTIKVKNIFENLPVRKKFLKSDRTLWANIMEVVEKVALGVPQVSILLLRDHKKVFQSQGQGQAKNHLYSILGKDIVSHLQEVSFQSSSYQIQGYFSDNQVYRSSRVHEYIYINQRFIRNLYLSRAIEEVYQSKIPLQKYPLFVLYITIDPSLIDVNIHPKKHEVKLSNENQLVPILKEMLETQFKGSSIPKLETLGKERKEEESVDLLATFPKNPKNSLEEKIEVEEGNFLTLPLEESLVDLKEDGEGEDYDLRVSLGAHDGEEAYEKVSLKEDLEAKNEEASGQWIQALRDTSYVGALFKTYLIFQGKETLYLMDQHAAHERILYEKYKKEYEREEVHRQILLAPEIINLNPGTMAILENYQEDFSRLGFVFDSFGDQSILLREVPFIFGQPGSKLFIENILANLPTAKNKYSFNQYNIMRKACRSAIKAHDFLEDMEVESLVGQLIQAEDPYTCPHGRPTVIRMTQRDLEKIFLRVGPWRQNSLLLQAPQG